MNKFHDLRARGCMAYGGELLVRWDYPDRPTTYLPLDLTVGRSAEQVMKELARRGFTILGKGARDRVADILSDVGTFPSENVIRHVGWSQGYFAFATGDIAAAKGVDPMRAIFRAYPGLHLQRGSVKGWKRLVGSVLMGQPLPIFAAALPLAAALVQIMGRTEGLLFEIVDPSGGSGVLAQIASSITGDIGAGIVPFESFLREGDELRSAHASGLIIVDDARAELARLAPSRRGSAVLGCLQEHRRESVPQARSGPTSVMLLGDQSVIELAGAANTVGDAIAKQLLTLRPPTSNSFGVFAAIPDNVETTNDLTAALADAIAQHHGSPLRVFIKRLIRDLSADGDQLRTRVRSSMALFRRKAKVDLNDPAAVSIVDKFALVYAAARLAVSYGIFPKDWQYGPAIKDCYKHYFSGFVQTESAADMVKSWSQRPDVIVLHHRDRRTADEIRAASIFIRTTKTKKRLLVRQGFLAALVDDEQRFLKSSDARDILIRDGQHLTRNCKLHPELAQERMYCFSLETGPRP